MVTKVGGFGRFSFLAFLFVVWFFSVFFFVLGMTLKRKNAFQPGYD